MATITVNKGNSLLKTLGGIATIGGAFAGAPAWLTPLGMGLRMLGGGSTGGGQDGGNSNPLFDMLAGLGIKLGGGSISGKDTQQQQQPQLRGSNTDAELIKQWGTNPHNNGIYGLGGFNAWLR